MREKITFVVSWSIAESMAEGVGARLLIPSCSEIFWVTFCWNLASGHDCEDESRYHIDIVTTDTGIEGTGRCVQGIVLIRANSKCGCKLKARCAFIFYRFHRNILRVDNIRIYGNRLVAIGTFALTLDVSIPFSGIGKKHHNSIFEARSKIQRINRWCRGVAWIQGCFICWCGPVDSGTFNCDGSFRRWCGLVASGAFARDWFHHNVLKPALVH